MYRSKGLISTCYKSKRVNEQEVYYYYVLFHAHSGITIYLHQFSCVVMVTD